MKLLLAAAILLLTATTEAQAERYRLFNRFRLVPSAASQAGMPNARPGGVGSRLNGNARPMPSIEYDTPPTPRGGPTKAPPPPIIINKGLTYGDGPVRK